MPPAEPVGELWLPEGEPVELDGNVAEPVPFGDAGPVVDVPDGLDWPEPEPPPPEGLDCPLEPPPLGDELPPELEGDDGVEGIPDGRVGIGTLQAASDKAHAVGQKCLIIVIRCID